MSKRDLFDRCVWLIVGTALWTVTLSDKPTLASCTATEPLSFVSESAPLLFLGLAFSIFASYLLDRRFVSSALSVVVGLVPIIWLVSWDKDCARSAVSPLRMLELFGIALIPYMLGSLLRLLVSKIRSGRVTGETSA